MQGKGQGTREGKEEKKQGKETLIRAEYDNPGVGGGLKERQDKRLFYRPDSFRYVCRIRQFFKLIYWNQFFWKKNVGATIAGRPLLCSVHTLKLKASM